MEVSKRNSIKIETFYFTLQLNEISLATEKHGTRVLRLQKFEISMLQFYTNYGCFSLSIIGCRLGKCYLAIHRLYIIIMCIFPQYEYKMLLAVANCSFFMKTRLVYMFTLYLNFGQF